MATKRTSALACSGFDDWFVASLEQNFLGAGPSKGLQSRPRLCVLFETSRSASAASESQEMPPEADQLEVAG